MKTKIDVSIMNIGHTRGSVGWLSKAVKTAKFQTDDGHRSCWLTIDGNSELVLSENVQWCPFGGWIDGERINRNVIRETSITNGIESSFDADWTDSGWKSLTALVDQLEELFADWITSEPILSDTIKFEFNLF